jgi:hypothetical protein
MPKKPTKGTGRKTQHVSKKAREEQTLADTSSVVVREDLSELAQSLLFALIRKSPKLTLLKPLQPGGVAPELQFDRAAVQRLFTAAAMDGNQQGLLMWIKDDSELLVNAGKVRVDLDDGLVIVTIPVSCDQTGDVSIEVPFAVGGKNRPAGMVVATEESPRGPAQIVELWGESLTAFAWRILLAVTTKVASNHGVDQDRESLIPAALTASRDGLRLVAMARHTFDRVIK